MSQGFLKEMTSELRPQDEERSGGSSGTGNSICKGLDTREYGACQIINALCFSLLKWVFMRNGRQGRKQCGFLYLVSHKQPMDGGRAEHIRHPLHLPTTPGGIPWQPELMVESKKNLTYLLYYLLPGVLTQRNSLQPFLAWMERI